MPIAFGALGLPAALALIVRPPARCQFCALLAARIANISVSSTLREKLQTATHSHIIRKPSNSQIKIVTHANVKMAPREMTAIGHTYPGAIFAVLVAEMSMASLRFLAPLL